jgi:hypothetical protein
MNGRGYRIQADQKNQSIEASQAFWDDVDGLKGVESSQTDPALPLRHWIATIELDLPKEGMGFSEATDYIFTKEALAKAKEVKLKCEPGINSKDF